MQKLSCALTLSLLCSAAMAQPIYQWKDTRGVAQYGQLPPAGIPYQQINIKTSPPPGGQLREPAPLPSQSDDHGVSEAAAQRQLSRENAKQRAAACDKIRDNLETLVNNPRLRRTTEAGEVIRIDEDERQQLIAKAQLDLQDSCQG